MSRVLATGIFHDKHRNQLADANSVAHKSNVGVLPALPRGLPHVRHDEFIDGLFSPLNDILETLAFGELLPALM